MKSNLVALSAIALCLAAAPVFAAENEYNLTIKNHVFTPDTLEIPADTKVTIIVKNEDTTAEEFESHSLKREKVIAAGGTAKVLVGPLKAGEYPFVGEYHEETAKGKIVVK